MDLDPGRGDPDAVRDVSGQFAARADGMTERARAGRAALESLAGLESAALEALRARVASVVDKFERAADAATEASDILGGYAASLDDIRSRARALLDDAQASYDRIWWRRGQALNEASETITGWALGWDDPALDVDGVIRLETGFVTDGDPDSGAIEGHNIPGNGTIPAIDAHSTILQRGTGAFENIVAVITGGSAELYAPDETLYLQGYPVHVSGIESSDYTPQYTEVE